ncbi:MAG: alanine dehydrogenase [Bacteroidota bacterium]
MEASKQKVYIPKSLIEEQFQPQTELLAVQEKQSKLYIGVPAESIIQEKRVALVPSSVKTLVSRGHRVLIERGAGLKANFPDRVYTEVGAEIAHSQEQVYQASTVIKVAPPTLKEIDLMSPGQILITPLQLPIINANYIKKLQQKRVIALAMEYMKDKSGSFPVVRIMSEQAGLCAILTAAELLTNSNGGPGVLLGGVSGVPPAKVVILGAGIVAEYAARTALGLGAAVRVFDDSIYKLRRLQSLVGQQLYTSVLNPVYLERELIDADVVIGAMHAKSGRTPMVVSEEMVANMKSGAVIVDVSIDQGGCFETSEVTTHEQPTFTKHEVIHYCVPNIASKISRTSSIAISNILTTILLRAADSGSVEKLIFDDYGLRNGVYAYKGKLTNEYLGKRFNIPSTNLDLFLTAGS